MQPITQANLDPKLNDIRHLRAEQSLDGVIDCFGPSILYRGTTRAFLQACTCMDVQESQSNWPDMRKTLGKPGFCSGEERNRTYACFPCVIEEFERYQFPSTLPLITSRNRFPLASVYSVCSLLPCVRFVPWFHSVTLQEGDLRGRTARKAVWFQPGGRQFCAISA